MPGKTRVTPLNTLTVLYEVIEKDREKMKCGVETLIIFIELKLTLIRMNFFSASLIKMVLALYLLNPFCTLIYKELIYYDKGKKKKLVLIER